MRKLLLVIVLAPTLFHWERVRDAYRVHQRFVNSWGLVMGDYYQWRVDPRTYPPLPPSPFRAQCSDGKPTDFATEPQAKAFVENCPLWN